MAEEPKFLVGIDLKEGAEGILSGCKGSRVEISSGL